MAKGTPKKDKTPDKVPKVKKSTGTGIFRDHPIDNLIHGKRKRVPTERLVQSLKQKPKAPVKKKAGDKKGSTSTPKKSAEKKSRSPAASDSKKKAAKSRSRSKSKKSKKSDDGEGKESDGKSPEKFLSRTRTMADTIAASKKLLKGGKPKSRTRSGGSKNKKKK